MRIYIYEDDMHECDTCECAAVLKALKEQEKAERGEAFDGKLNSWDFNYYHTLLKQRKYTIDEDEVCTYFKLTTFSKLLLLLLLPHDAQNVQIHHGRGWGSYVLQSDHFFQITTASTIATRYSTSTNTPWTRMRSVRTSTWLQLLNYARFNYYHTLLTQHKWFIDTDEVRHYVKKTTTPKLPLLRPLLHAATERKWTIDEDEVRIHF